MDSSDAEIAPAAEPDYHCTMDFLTKSVKNVAAHSLVMPPHSCESVEPLSCNGTACAFGSDSTLIANGHEDVEGFCQSSITKTNSSQRCPSVVPLPLPQTACLIENNLSNLSIAEHISSNHAFTRAFDRTDKLCAYSGSQEPNLVTNHTSTESHPRLDDCQHFSPDEDGSTMKNKVDIAYIRYESETQMPDIMKLIQKDLSEPYSIYTYRYFIHNWPHLCFLATSNGNSVGAIVCKLDLHRKVIRRGYIAMLAVDESYRKHGIGSNLVLKAIRVMAAEGADEVVLETEITNQPALRLYENLGFVRDKRLFRYYLNGVDALRLKLWLR